MKIESLFKPKEKCVISLLATESLAPNPLQPRKAFDEAELRSLAESIKAHGLIQPIVVKKNYSLPYPMPKAEAEYEIVAGERRWRACKLANLKTVKCIIIDADRSESAFIALTENIQRSDLSYFEEALAMQNLLLMTGMSQTELAASLSISQSALSNKLRLLRLSERERLMAAENGFSERQARALVRVGSEKERRPIMLAIIKEKLSSVETEKLVESYLQGCNSEKNALPRKKSPKIRGNIGNIRFLFNTLDKSVKILQGAGYSANWEKQEAADEVTVTICIKKQVN